VEAGEDYGALMAAATLVTAPLVLAFLFAQRRFIEGITMTGLKG
jgi:multiple sugar transport system permease protein